MHRLEGSIGALKNWLREKEHRGYDPFDGLGSPIARRLVSQRRLARILRTFVQQTVLRCPVNLRPLLAITPTVNYKAMAFLAMGFLSLFRTKAIQEDKNSAVACLRWLQEHSNREYSGSCWSNPHDYQSRVFYLPKGVPTIVGSAHVARAFIDGYETLGNTAYLGVARSTCDFILNDLPRFEENGSACISYVPFGVTAIHNASMLAAEILVRVYRHTGEPQLIDAARLAVRYTVGHQRADGSWYYGEARDLHWVDSFHSGYVLDSLQSYLSCDRDDAAASNALSRGIEHFSRNLIGEDGRPFLYPRRRYPVDIQGAAQTCETLTKMSSLDPECLGLAQHVACWTIKHMQDEDGHFFFRRYQWGVNKIAHIHWGQATMLAALATLLERLSTSVQADRPPSATRSLAAAQAAMT